MKTTAVNKRTDRASKQRQAVTGWRFDRAMLVDRKMTAQGTVILRLKQDASCDLDVARIVDGIRGMSKITPIVRFRVGNTKHVAVEGI
jgi:hypothetical protein